MIELHIKNQKEKVTIGMQQQHKDAIQNNFSSLVERTDLNSMVAALFERGVFSEQMIEQYKDTNVPPRDRKQNLYRAITRRGPDAFRHLLEVLSEVGHWDLVRELDPNSPFRRNTRPTPSSQPPVTDENNFVSISTEKNKTKNELQKNNSRPQPPPAPQPPPQPDKLANSDPAVTSKLEVIKSTSFIEEDDSKDLKLYRTGGARRGLALIFSYMLFDNDIEEVRHGVDVDNENLKYLFSEIGFKVMLSQNYSKKNTLDTLESLKEMPAGVESLFVVVSSHGYETRGSDTHIRCSDGQLVSTYDIIEHFNNKNMPALRGVPKVFIFQSCRGQSVDYVWRAARAPPHMAMPTDSGGGDGGGGDDGGGGGAGAAAGGPPRRAAAAAAHHYSEKGAIFSDILIAHSTLPGFVSRRDPALGSWYIQVLCEVFAARAHDCHVEKLLTLVDRRLQERFQVQTSSIDKWGFNKLLYLHPGLFR